MNRPIEESPYPAALARAREIAGANQLTSEHLRAAAKEFGIHQGAFFVEFVGYAEAQGAI